MYMSTIAQARALSHHRSCAQRGTVKAMRWLLVLAVSGACALLVACSPGTLAEDGSLPSSTPGQLAPTATVSTTPVSTTPPMAMPETATPGQQEDAWARVRAALPAKVAVFRPAFVPERFGPPEFLEARTDDEHGTCSTEHGSCYTVIYQAGDELLVFILGNGQGALGNAAMPSSDEPITVHDGVQGTLMTSHGSPPLWVSWQEQGGSYQIKVYPGRMAKDELLRIAQSMVPIK